MTESVSRNIEVFSLREKADAEPAADAVINGKITMLRVGPVFSLAFNPKVAGLADKLVFLKERGRAQYFSLVCTYGQALRFVDRKRVNEDFFRLSEYICGRVLVRIPVDTAQELPFPYNSENGTVQFLDFKRTHPIRSAFVETLARKGCEYLAITSGNIHGAPTIEDVESAKMLAVVFNVKAEFLGMSGAETVVTDIPGDNGIAQKGSYTILSFCNPAAVEVKRLTNNADRDFTEKYLKELLADVKFKTPLVYAL